VAEKKSPSFRERVRRNLKSPSTWPARPPVRGVSVGVSKIPKEEQNTSLPGVRVTVTRTPKETNKSPRAAGAEAMQEKGPSIRSPGAKPTKTAKAAPSKAAKPSGTKKKSPKSPSSSATADLNKRELQRVKGGSGAAPKKTAKDLNLEQLARFKKK
jgi:hypothetical protein